MTAKTFTQTGGGSWETTSAWTPSGVPGSGDTALIGTNVAGTYTVTLSAVESPLAVTLDDAAATLLIASGGQLIDSSLTLTAGTLALDGIINSATVIDAGGAFTPDGGTLIGATWQGLLAGPGSSFQTLNVADGITLLNAAGTAPGTLDIGSLYMVTIEDSTPLNNLTIAFGNFNNEYLNGSNSAALVLGGNANVTQALASSTGEISGLALTNNGTISATASGSNLLFLSSTFNNAGSVTVSGGDHMTVYDGFANSGSVAVTTTGTLSLITTNNTLLSNSNTISTSYSSTLVADANLAGSGTLALSNFGVDDIFGTSNTVQFLDAKGTLRLEAPTAFSGTILGFQSGDVIDLLKQQVTSLSYAGSSTSGVLTVKNGTTVVATLNLLGNYVSGSTGSPDFQFGFAPDNGTGNDITVSYVQAEVPRTLVWIGPSNGNLSTVANWNDTTDGLNPATWSLNTTDTLVFGASTESVIGNTSVAALTVGGDGALVMNVGASLTASGAIMVGTTGAAGLSIEGGSTLTGNGAVIANTASAAGSSVDVSGSGSDLAVTGRLDVGAAGSGELSLSDGATVTAGSLDTGNIAAAVGNIGLTDIGTKLIVSGSATVADDGTGVLSVLSGATFSASSLTVGNQGDSSGAVVVSGTGSLINLSGALNIGTSLGTGDMTVGPGAAVHAGVVNLQGQVVLEGGLLDPTVQLINQGQTAGGFGTIAAGDIVDEGVIQAGGNKASQKLLLVEGTVMGGGTLTVNGTQPGSNPTGVLQINAGGTMELTGAVLNAATTTFTDNLSVTGTYTVNNSVIDVTFADATGVLLLDDIAGFAGKIATFEAGDKFVITGGTLSNLGVSNGNTLTFSDSGPNAVPGGVDSISFGSGISAAGFSIANGDTVQVACFAAGTRIETTAGMVRVEDLAIGDRVVTADGGEEPIVWIGQRDVNCARHPSPETVWPVRVAADSFGDNTPVRDLYLSPDHAVFVNGVLAPVKLLMNDTSIAQVKRASVTYYHVELPRHAIILAEGLLAESYLDTGDRADFQQPRGTFRLLTGFATRLAPNAALAWESRGVAPLVVTGEALAAVRGMVAGKFATGRRMARQSP